MGIIRGRSRQEPGETEWQKRGTGGPPVHASSFYTLVKHSCYRSKDSRAGCATRAKLANQLLYAKFAQASNPEDVPKGTRCALKVSEM